MSRSESFHHYNDGRGKRRVYVNGNEVERVIWCDTAQGIVVFCPYPVRVNRKRDVVYSRRLRGAVTVERVE
jgi:hypothetical protein